MSLSYTSAAAEAGLGCGGGWPRARLWGLWALWAISCPGDRARRQGGGNARLVAGEPTDNLAVMDSWPAVRVPELPGRGPETVVWDTASGRLADAARGYVATMYACGIPGRAFHDPGKCHPATGSGARLTSQPKITKHRG